LKRCQELRIVFGKVRTEAYAARNTTCNVGNKVQQGKKEMYKLHG